MAGVELPGVYLLARFKPRQVPGSVNPLDDNIVYVGETTRSFLRKRWYQFNRSAFEQKAGHSGGWSYARLHGKDTSKLLFVSALPCDLEETKAAAYIRFIERLILWEFVARHGRFPDCNGR